MKQALIVTLTCVAVALGGIVGNLLAECVRDKSLKVRLAALLPVTAAWLLAFVLLLDLVGGC